MEESMEYIQVFMEYESVDMPLVYFYEVDLSEGRFAHRAMEVFTSRKVHHMKDLYSDVIEKLPIPTLDELNTGVWGEDFYAVLISREDFERVWKTGMYSGSLTSFHLQKDKDRL